MVNLDELLGVIEGSECLNSILNDPMYDVSTNTTTIKQKLGDPLILRFKEINYFIEVNKKDPSENSISFKEKSLAAFLKEVKMDERLVSRLSSYDKFKLLDDAVNKSLKDETLNLDDLLKDIVDTGTDTELLGKDYFAYYVKRRRTSSHTNPERIASTKKCEDFYKFEHLFKDIIHKVKVGEYNLARYKGNIRLAEGTFISYKGKIGYIASLGEKFLTRDKSTNRRLRIIYDNRTEIDMLELSLKRSLKLYHDSFVVVPNTGNNKNTPYGKVYIVGTESNDPKLAMYQGELFKIGRTDNDISVRLANACNSSTYLYSAVHCVATIDGTEYKDSKKLEKELHEIFSPFNLDVTLINNENKMYRPREWFNVPLNTIKEAIERINDDTINDYYIDPDKKVFVKIQ